MKIEFDETKRIITLETRGLDMAVSADIFQGDTITFEDDRRDYGERRFITIGFLGGHMVFVAWTPRGAARRIISLRKANDRERKKYGPRFKTG